MPGSETQFSSRNSRRYGEYVTVKKSSQHYAEDPVTGCRGCASGPGGESNIFGNKYGQHLAAIQVAREELQQREVDDGLLEGPQDRTGPEDNASEASIVDGSENVPEEDETGGEVLSKRARHADISA